MCLSIRVLYLNIYIYTCFKSYVIIDSLNKKEEQLLFFCSSTSCRTKINAEYLRRLIIVIVVNPRMQLWRKKYKKTVIDNDVPINSCTLLLSLLFSWLMRVNVFHCLFLSGFQLSILLNT